MADVFVSYSRSDKARVAPLVAALEAEGWSVWWDPAIPPGQQFDRLIADELDRARAVLVVWTPDSVESRWVRGEAREGADRGILVPVQFGPARLPIDFRAFHTTDLGQSGEVAGSPHFPDVVRAIEALAGRAPGSVAATTPPPPVTGATSGAPRIAICVLPFANLSGDPEQQYFSDGITADIITELSRWRLLAVRSRSASFKYRGPAVDTAQLARELNVRFVVEGAVRRMGDRVRVSVQLIDAETGNQVWGERFDRTQAEIFTVQDEVVQTIVGTLVGRVHVSDAERARRKPPSSLEAYECVLQGNGLYWDDPAGAAEAKRLFERAIEIDPKYGLAYALLATMTCQKWRDDDSGNSNALLDEAYTLAMRAVELDDGDSTCQSLLAQVCLYRRSFELALEHMQRSMALNPNNQWNAADMGLILVYLGRADEALAWNQRARQIDPYFDQPWYWRQSGVTCMVLNRYEDALKLFARYPIRKYYIAANMAGCHARLGDLEHARASVAECLALKPDFSVRRWMTKEPFKLEADAARIEESLRLAGLPD